MRQLLHKRRIWTNLIASRSRICCRCSRPFLALCVIGGAPPNFRSRRTSRPAETNSGTGELTYSGPSPNLVGASMNGSKRSSAMLQSSATGEPSPPSEQMESVLPRPLLEKQLSIPSCRYGVRTAHAANEALWLLFGLSSHRFRPKDGCRRRCGCDDESAGDCASLPALLGYLSTPKANWG